MQDKEKVINRSFLVDSLISLWNRTIIDIAKKRITRFVVLDVAVCIIVACDINKNEARKV